MDSTEKNFRVDKTGYTGTVIPSTFKTELTCTDGKFGNNVLFSPLNSLGDYDAPTFSHPYGHGGMLQTSDDGFPQPNYKWTYVPECGGIHQSGSHSQRSTVQGIEEVLSSALDEKLSYEDGRSHEGIFAHSQESIDPWQYVHCDFAPPPPYTNEALNDQFLTSGISVDSKGAPVGQTSFGTTGDTPLPYGSPNASHYVGASKPNLNRNPVSGSMSQKFLHPHPQKRKTSVDPVLFCNRGKNARPVGSEKTTAAAEKRRHAQATLRCPLYVNGCNAIFTTRHNRQYHVNSHYGYKPYHCRKGCPYQASSPSTMKRHEKKCGVQQG
ncbi:hypothetical protein JOM56_000935 [Amanita muscaria]